MELTTERLVLRNFNKKDAQDVYEYLKDPSVNCFKCMQLTSVQEAEKELETRLDDEFYLAIVLKENGKVIGEISGHLENSDPENKVYDTISPCWMLNKTYQKNGYMYEALCAYYKWLFNEKSVRRIYIYTEDYNVACQRLCQKLKMRKEGEFKEFVSFVNDEKGEPLYENTWQYAILKKEWMDK